MKKAEYLCDLHVHSMASDGGYAAATLVRQARARGMSALALTDHDTLASHAEGFKAARELGVRVIPGVELTTRERYHILGYFVDGRESGLTSYLEGIRTRVWAFMDGVLERLRARGLTVTREELALRTGMGIPNMTHLLDVMFTRGDLKAVDFDNPYAVKFFGDPEYEVKFFLEFAATDPFTDAAGAVQLILDAGGVPVWAHPFRAARAEVLRLREAGLAGLEVTTPKHDPATREYLRALCAELDLVPTGGTDFHGRFFDSIEQGRRIGFCGAGPEIVERLEELAAARGRI
jgi:3',5'-nucleoside bisphosphate phosphatase